MSSRRWVPNGEDLTSLLGCKMGKLPTYLGPPLGASFKSWAIWEVVEENSFERLLFGRDYFSKGGSLMLIKSTLPNFLIYFMSMFFIQRKMCLSLKKIPKCFLWDGEPWEKTLFGEALKNSFLCSLWQISMYRPSSVWLGRVVSALMVVATSPILDTI